MGNVLKSNDPELHDALQPVFKILRERYSDGILIAKCTGADMYQNPKETHFFNKVMLEEYMSNPMFGMTKDMLQSYVNVQE